MTKDYFKEINEHTKATYYVLPLIYLNKFSFGSNNFVDSYVSADAQQIVVEVLDVQAVPGTPWASEMFIRQEGKFFFFEIPMFYRDAVRLYQQGKYSEMGDAAHSMIRAYSALQYRKPRYRADGTQVLDTDTRLLALEKSVILREYLEKLLSYVPDRGKPSYVDIDPESELMSPPTDREIWKEQKALAL